MAARSQIRFVEDFISYFVLLYEPLRVGPPNPFKCFELLRDAIVNIAKIPNIFEKLSLNIAREHLTRSLAQHMNLAKQQAMVLIRQDVILRRSCQR